MLGIDNPEPWAFEPAREDPFVEAHSLLVDYVNETLGVPPPSDEHLDHIEPTQRRHAFASHGPEDYQLGRALVAATGDWARQIIVAAVEQQLAMEDVGYKDAPRYLLGYLAQRLLEEGSGLTRETVLAYSDALLRRWHVPSIQNPLFKLVAVLESDPCLVDQVQDVLGALASRPIRSRGYAASENERIWALQSFPFRVNPHETWACRLWDAYLSCGDEGQAQWRGLVDHARSVRAKPSRAWLLGACRLADALEGDRYSDRFAAWIDGYVAQTEETYRNRPLLDGLVWTAAAVSDPPIEALREVALGGYSKVFTYEDEWVGSLVGWRAEACGSAALRALAHVGAVAELHRLREAIPHKRARGVIDRLLENAAS